jgi:hypothetical protein
MIDPRGVEAVQMHAEPQVGDGDLLQHARDCRQPPRVPIGGKGVL